MDGIGTPSGKIGIYIPEMEAQAKGLNAKSEAQDLKLPEEVPLILSAGRHLQYNANRNPLNTPLHRFVLCRVEAM